MLLHGGIEVLVIYPATLLMVHLSLPVSLIKPGVAVFLTSLLLMVLRRETVYQL